ncbi:DUF937 domain-containing protein [Deinococcus sonorensis]|uniref:DUF937 domain-containing protein n=2 Tax=Deinococcus sonorensis TaxID=309891 RepID=A0AAU7U8E9_9DEIO
MTLFDTLGSLIPQQAHTVSQQVGASPAQTEQAMQAAVPLLLSGLTRNVQHPQGEQALGQALEQHDGSVLDAYGNGQLPDPQQGQQIVNHVFGQQAGAAANAVGQHAGIDPQAAMQILSTVAPLVLGALARSRQGGSMGGGGLGGMLGSVLGGAMGGGLGGGGLSNGGLGGMLGGVLGGGQPQMPMGGQGQGQNDVLSTLSRTLDGNGNGSALDDLVGMLGGRRG